jgi:hypothetical protein
MGNVYAVGEAVRYATGPLQRPKEKHNERIWVWIVGEVTSISVLGRLVVFINSARAAKALFEQTGTLYMDRPAIPIIDMYAICLLSRRASFFAEC